MSETIQGTRHSIMFSKSMANAVVAGRKTQTRRLAVRIPGRKRDRQQVTVPTASKWTTAKVGDVLLCKASHYAKPFARAVITGVRTEDLHALTAADAMAEGITAGRYQTGGFTADPEARHLYAGTPIEAFRVLWETLHGLGAWERNPRVVVLSFRVLLPEEEG